MKVPRPTTPQKKILDDTFQQIIESSQDLLEAEENEDYELCALISDTLNVFLLNRAQMLAEIKTGFTSTQIFQVLRNDADEALKMLREQD